MGHGVRPVGRRVRDGRWCRHRELWFSSQRHGEQGADVSGWRVLGTRAVAPYRYTSQCLLGVHLSCLLRFSGECPRPVPTPTRSLPFLSPLPPRPPQEYIPFGFVDLRSKLLADHPQHLADGDTRRKFEELCRRIRMRNLLRWEGWGGGNGRAAK